jgi:hypothetical protein
MCLVQAAGMDLKAARDLAELRGGDREDVKLAAGEVLDQARPQPTDQQPTDQQPRVGSKNR